MNINPGPLNLSDLSETFHAKLTAAINAYIAGLPVENQIDLETSSMNLGLEPPDGDNHRPVLLVAFEIHGESVTLMRLDATRFGIHIINGEVVVIEPDTQ